MPFSSRGRLPPGGTREATPAPRGAVSGNVLLAPVGILVVRLVAAYRQDSVNPTLAAYYIELLALVFLTLAFYRLSSFAFRPGRPAALCFTPSPPSHCAWRPWQTAARCTAGCFSQAAG